MSSPPAVFHHIATGDSSHDKPLSVDVADGRSITKISARSDVEPFLKDTAEDATVSKGDIGKSSFPLRKSTWDDDLSTATGSDSEEETLSVAPLVCPIMLLLQIRSVVRGSSDFFPQLEKLVETMSERSGLPKSLMREHLLEQVSVSVWRANQQACRDPKPD